MNKSRKDISAALALWEDTEAQMASLSSNQRAILNQMTDENLFGNGARGANNTLEVEKDNFVNVDDGTASSTAKSGGQKSSKLKSNKSDSVKTHDSKPVKLDTGRDFLDWLDRMETNIQVEKDSHFNVYHDQINELSDCVQSLLKEVDKGLAMLDFLREQNLSASTRSNNLHSVCDDLMTKMSSMNEMKNEIEAKEKVFKNADKVVAQSNHTLNPESLCKLLDEIESCLKFFQSHQNFKDSSKYQVKCQAASSRVLTFIKDYFRSSLERNGEQSENQSFDLFYGRLKMISPKFFKIMEHLFNKSDNSPLKEDIDSALQECVNIFIQSRRNLVIQSLQFTLEDSVKKFERDHCSLVRSASISLFHLLRDEEALLGEFFPALPQQSAEDYFDSICIIFYDSLRPKIVKLHHLETLSEISSILRCELNDHRSDTVSDKSFHTSITQLWQDVQERLVYRAYIFIKSDIQDFSPHEGDLLYPEKLQMMLAIAEDSAVKDSPADIHGMWYPTVRRTLMCLSKLYRSVEKEIFQEVSHEALKACIGSIVYASGMIQAKKTPFDGQLFLIKHLLILREQITPFNIIHSSSETALDFSNLWNERRISIPEVKELQLDYRREVDRLLKATCEAFIRESAHQIVGPLSTAILKVTAVKNQSASTLNEKVTEAMKNMKKIIPIIQQKMSLYLANKETEFILYKPIRVNILETFQKFSKLIEENFDDQDIVVIGCPNIDMLTVTLSSMSLNTV